MWLNIGQIFSPKGPVLVECGHLLVTSGRSRPAFDESNQCRPNLGRIYAPGAEAGQLFGSCCTESEFARMGRVIFSVSLESNRLAQGFRRHTAQTRTPGLANCFAWEGQRRCRGGSGRRSREASGQLPEDLAAGVRGLGGSAGPVGHSGAAPLEEFYLLIDPKSTSDGYVLFATRAYTKGVFL